VVEGVRLELNVEAFALGDDVAELGFGEHPRLCIRWVAVKVATGRPPYLVESEEGARFGAISWSGSGAQVGHGFGAVWGEQSEGRAPRGRPGGWVCPRRGGSAGCGSAGRWGRV